MRPLRRGLRPLFFRCNLPQARFHEDYIDARIIGLRKCAILCSYIIIAIVGLAHVWATCPLPYRLWGRRSEAKHPAPLDQVVVGVFSGDTAVGQCTISSILYLLQTPGTQSAISTIGRLLVWTSLSTADLPTWLTESRLVQLMEWDPLHAGKSGDNESPVRDHLLSGLPVWPSLVD
ncbi:unnamed protein product [Protopolystoma xenopodis]|uniref:Uncharacterized protein n=1 Tax=Protopolystoma xenopodis TaxID=117903 RepID=A0A3S5CV11_9PLAT|nr:unnamed protein product [Protopolystoma xenopodis]